jgi:hypothetical protein
MNELYNFIDKITDKEIVDELNTTAVINAENEFKKLLDFLKLKTGYVSKKLIKVYLCTNE